MKYIVFSFLILSSFVTFAEDGVTDSQILLGQSMAYTGTASIGPGIVQGTNLVIDKVNAAGGVHGRKLKIVSYDDGYDVDKNFENLRKATEHDKVFAIFQNFGAGGAKKAFPMIEEKDIPFVFPIGSAEDLRSPTRKNVFTLRASTNAELNAMVKFITHKLGVKEIGLFYQTDPSGLGIRTGVLKAVHQNGAKLVADLSLPRNSEDVDKTVDELTKIKPKAVIIGAQTKAAIKIVTKAKEKGFNPIYAAPTSLGSPDFLEAVKGSTAYISFGIPVAHKSSQMKLIQDFIKDATAAKVEIGSAQLEGYLNTLVLVEALKRAGQDLTRKKFVSALEGMKNADFGGVKLSYSDKDHRGLDEAYMTQVRDGAIVPVD